MNTSPRVDTQISTLFFVLSQVTNVTKVTKVTKWGRGTTLLLTWERCGNTNTSPRVNESVVYTRNYQLLVFECEIFSFSSTRWWSSHEISSPTFRLRVQIRYQIYHSFVSTRCYELLNQSSISRLRVREMNLGYESTLVKCFSSALSLWIDLSRLSQTSEWSKMRWFRYIWSVSGAKGALVWMEHQNIPLCPRGSPSPPSPRVGCIT